MVSLKRLAAEDLRRKLKKQKENHVDVFVFKRKHRRKQPHPSPSLLHPHSSTENKNPPHFFSHHHRQKNKNNTGKKTQTHNDRRERRAPKPKNMDSAAGVFDDCNDIDRRSQKAPKPKKRNSVAVHHRNSNHQLPIQIVPLPASMLEKIMRELKGRGMDEKLVFEKNIMASDIRKGQNRLTMSQDYGDRVLTRLTMSQDYGDRVLTTSERASLTEKAKTALLIDPNNNIWQLHFNFWPAVRRYALNGRWNNVVDANVMRAGLDRVQLWSFRGEQDTLCFALNILER